MSPHFTETMEEFTLTNGSAVNGTTNGHIEESAPAPVLAEIATESVQETLPELVNGGLPVDSHKHIPTGSLLKPAAADEVHDVICCGFGPASLAIAIATNDALEAGTLKEAPKMLFLEKQQKFAWHAGMLLPGAKMQISFIKDLASLRDPRSNFTFLNFLHKNDRLVDFTNLSTFLPARAEYDEYLRWCSRHFDDVVKYQNEVISVSPAAGEEGPQKIFTVTTRHSKTGELNTYKTRNVIVAIGGQASIPNIIPAHSPRVVHSSQYETRVPQLFKDRSAPIRVAVIGGGQSAAEIFNNVQHLYPNSKTYLVMKQEFLKPSDDSPFVNSIFNPEFVDALYPKSASYRAHLIADARATNYGVVRLELIEHLYEKMYDQRREIGKDETKWPHRILGGRRLLSVDETKSGDGLRVKVCLSLPGEAEAQVDGPLLGEETLDVDLVISATGYKRTAHVDMLKDAWKFLPAPQAGAPIDRTVKDRWYVDAPVEGKEETETRIIEVGRDYGVRFQEGKVAPGSGVWFQGCCEGTHGLSDTLLSVLATRSGEMVDSIFGKGKQ